MNKLVRTTSFLSVLLLPVLSASCRSSDWGADSGPQAPPPPAASAPALPKVQTHVVGAPANRTEGAAERPADPGRPVLATYPLPRGLGERVVGLLRDLLVEGEHPIGRVTLAPGDRVIVVAPESIQEGVSETMKSLADAPPPPPPATIQLHYWLVLGRPAAQASGMERLGEGAVAMDAIMRSQGPLDLRLVDEVRLASMEGEWAEVGGRKAHIEQRVARIGDRVIADLNVGAVGNLRTRVQLEPGKFVVLGQVGYDEHEAALAYVGPGAPEPVQDALLYYVVRAEIMGSAD
ncbi:MAG: hypothetical protein HY825_02325 [Acidobacteria bacterium]|nr:hypothetical protein [Acidobacteriota bacterium]